MCASSHGHVWKMSGGERRFFSLLLLPGIRSLPLFGGGGRGQDRAVLLVVCQKDLQTRG